jgi:trans-aconitate 2-methyltransferase
MKLAAPESKVTAMTANNCTFGDNGQASARLRRLAELYEPETREWLQRCGAQSPHLAVDLGCGPGWSTRLLQQVVGADRTVGLDASERCIAEARNNNNGDAGVEFAVHDITHAPFPVAAPNVLSCRFLLTHLRARCGACYLGEHSGAARATDCSRNGIAGNGPSCLAPLL